MTNIGGMLPACRREGTAFNNPRTCGTPQSYTGELIKRNRTICMSGQHGEGQTKTVLHDAGGDLAGHKYGDCCSTCKMLLT